MTIVVSSKILIILVILMCANECPLSDMTEWMNINWSVVEICFPVKPYSKAILKENVFKINFDGKV